MESFFVLMIYLAYYLWYIFLPLGGLLIYLGWRRFSKTSTRFAKIGSIALLVIALPFVMAGLYGAFIKLWG